MLLMDVPSSGYAYVPVKTYFDEIAGEVYSICSNWHWWHHPKSVPLHCEVLVQTNIWVGLVLVLCHFYLQLTKRFKAKANAAIKRRFTLHESRCVHVCV